MTFFQSLILGLIQGITEFIPVSSSGHLTLFGKIFDVDSALMMSYTTLLHVGTLAAVIVVMRKEILEIIRDLFGPRTWQLVIATIPAVIAAVLFGDWIESMFAGGTLGYHFLMTGVILLSTLLIRSNRNMESKYRPVQIDAASSDPDAKSKAAAIDEAPVPATDNTADKDVSYKEALAAGLGQAFAILPGISRSGSTLAAMLYCKVNRKKAIRFSFLMSIPAIAGGFVLDLIKLFKGEGSAITQINSLNLIIGVLAAAVSGYLAMNYMLKKLTAKGLLVFSIYVLVLGLLILIDQTWLNRVF